MNLDEYSYPGRQVLSFVVDGDPVGQGQIRSLGKGRPAVHANGATLKPWRNDVAEAAREAIADLATACDLLDREPVGPFPLLGPIAVRAVFTVRKPKTVDREYPTVNSRYNSDTDHLLRAILDAMSKVVYLDDAQVIDPHPVKTYPAGCPGAHRLASGVPGVRVWIYTVGSS